LSFHHVIFWECTRAPVGTVNLANVKCCIGRGLAAVRYQECNKFLFYFFRYIEKKLDEQGTGSTFRAISGDILKNVSLSFPPLPEQHRIVAKIEALFSELDKGVESLKTAREQLKTYRQALLKQAFSGKLTEQWRAENSDKLETAAALLQRIQTEREQRYRQQLNDWEATGKQGTKPKAPKTLPPLTAEELAELPELPEGWAWVKFGQVFDIYVGSTPSRKRDDFWNGDINWISSGEVSFCRIKNTKEKITNTGYMNASTEIHPVGTVILAMIGEGKTRGQAAILDIKATHNQNTAAIRVCNSGLPSEYLYQYLFYQYENTRKSGSGNNQKALNKERVSDLKLPICDILEMNAIVSFFDEKLSVTDQLDQTLTAALQQAETLRQSILKKAFSGQLVPQDPSDEPASELLKRIQAEKAALIPLSQKGKNHA
jgi:type I restriction enzyme, S subunit